MRHGGKGCITATGNINPGPIANVYRNWRSADAERLQAGISATRKIVQKQPMFVTPVKGAKAVKAAQEAGFGKPESIHSVRIEGGDKPGLGSKIARALGNAGVSFRGVSAVAIGKKFISYIACDSAEDAARAIAVLKKL